jgi:hypothetical protein
MSVAHPTRITNLFLLENLEEEEAALMERDLDALRAAAGLTGVGAA